MEIQNYTTIDNKSEHHKLTQEIENLRLSIEEIRKSIEDLTDFMLSDRNKNDIAIKSLGIENRQLEEMMKKLHIKLEANGIRIWTEDEARGIY